MSQQNPRDLVPVHGGLDAPVDRLVALKDRKAFLAEATGLVAIRVNAADLSTIHRLADGALSPLEGPMKKAEERTREGQLLWPNATPMVDPTLLQEAEQARTAAGATSNHATTFTPVSAKTNSTSVTP